MTTNNQIAALGDLEFSSEEVAAFVEEADRLILPHVEYAVFRRLAANMPTELYDLARAALLGSVLVLSLDRSIRVGPIADGIARRSNPIRNLEQKILFERLVRVASLDQGSSIRSGLKSNEIDDDLIEQRLQSWIRAFPI